MKHKFVFKLPGRKEAGYSYVDADKVFGMVELCINDCGEFIYIIKGTHCGGFLSFYFLEGQIPVMNIGHGECIFKQYFFSPGSRMGGGWVLMGKLY